MILQPTSVTGENLPSEVILPMELGMVPDKPSIISNRCFRFVSELSDSGQCPVISVVERSRNSSSTSDPRLIGILPPILLLCMSRTFRFDASTILSGMLPPMSLWKSESLVSAVKSPKLEGKDPSSKLFPRLKSSEEARWMRNASCHCYCWHAFQLDLPSSRSFQTSSGISPLK